MRCAIWYDLYNLKSVKNTHGGVLFLVKLQAEACNFTKSNTPPWVFFTFFKLHKWYQIAQSITYVRKITKLILQLNNKKELGPISMPVSILIVNVNDLSGLHSHIINLSFKEGLCPKFLKIAQVTPVHKKYYRHYSDYRQISLLPVFSKLFEKLCIKE